MSALRLILIDSGVGGLSVARAIRKTLTAQIFYLADNAAFPYGALDDQALTARMEALVERARDLVDADALVIACNTASTIVLDRLRARHDLPIIGVVPAVKWAATLSVSRKIGILATRATARRPYLADLIARFAGDCEVFVQGANRLADLAERSFRGETVGSSDLIDEIAPLFAADGATAIDMVALGCTHFPLLQDRIEAAFPGRRFLDPAAAVARRVAQVARPGGVWRGELAPDSILFTSEPAHKEALKNALRAESFIEMVIAPYKSLPLTPASAKVAIPL